MAEYRNYIQNIPHLERPAILDSTGMLFPYVEAVDELMGTKVPPRAAYLRVIMAELNRIISHMYFLGIYGLFGGHTTMIDLGAWATGTSSSTLRRGSAGPGSPSPTSSLAG